MICLYLETNSECTEMSLFKPANYFACIFKTCLHTFLSFLFQIMVEGVKAGPSQVGDMAFDDVTLTDAQCPSPGHCDFEISMCSWSNVGGVDEEDWLRGRGDQLNLNTGPNIDHTTNSSQGNYKMSSSNYSINKCSDLFNH